MSEASSLFIDPQGESACTLLALSRLLAIVTPKNNINLKLITGQYNTSD